MTAHERERLFLEIFQSRRSSLQRLCYGFLGSSPEVEDLFQEILTNVWHSLPSFRGESAVSTWVYRIAVNTALVYRKKLKVAEELTDLPDTSLGAHHNLEQQERLHALERAISTLPDQERLVITLLLEGLSYKEIAEITGLTVNYVGVKISRIKQTLEQLITEVKHGAV
ncbi:MAG TPA: RNA polymerase sigma factor [Candidatus Sulfopaludibacter sp.]|nr:RNA polymerase sigma factor [Candidatus Sulfopaludibacter sp.]